MSSIKQKIKVEKKRSGIKAKVKPERKISGAKSQLGSNTVVASVRGGVAEIDKCPKGVDCFIVDNDNISQGYPYKYNGVDYEDSKELITQIKNDYKKTKEKYAIISVYGGVADSESSDGIKVIIKDYDDDSMATGGAVGDRLELLSEITDYYDSSNQTEGEKILVKKSKSIIKSGTSFDIENMLIEWNEYLDSDLSDQEKIFKKKISPSGSSMSTGGGANEPRYSVRSTGYSSFDKKYHVYDNKEKKFVRTGSIMMSKESAQKKADELNSSGDSMATGGKTKDELSNVFYLVLDKNERGEYGATVYNSQDKEIWDIDEEGVRELQEDGAIKYLPHEDLDRLGKYLSSIGKIPKHTNLLTEEYYNELRSSMATGGKTDESINLVDKLRDKYGAYIEDMGITEIFMDPYGELRITSKHDIDPSWAEAIEKDTRALSNQSLTYYIFEGYDHRNKKPLYKVVGRNNDYSGEWHTNRPEAEKELSELENKPPRGSMVSGGKAEDDYTKHLGMVEVIFADPKYNYQTNVSGDTTEEQARDYFVGKQFNMGVYPKESMQKVIDIKFHPKGTYYEGGSMAKGGKVGGRGFFGLKKGKRITSPEELGVGDIVLAHSDQFNADNTIKITDRRTYGALVHLSGIYWNPITNKRIGYEEFGVAPELSGNKYYFPESKNISKGNWEVSVGDIYQVGDMQYKIIKGNSRDKVEYLTKWATEKEWDPNSGGSLSINNFAVKGLFNDKTRIHPTSGKKSKKK